MSVIHFYCPSLKDYQKFKIYPEPVIYPDKPINDTQIVVSSQKIDSYPNPNLVIHLPENDIYDKLRALSFDKSKI